MTQTLEDKIVPMAVGDEWNVIGMLAKVQSDPRKSTAELVENGIDAHASHITITIGKAGSSHYIQVDDDGDGVKPNGDGVPDMERLPQNIGASFKRRLQEQERKGIQGKFAIGLLGFWSIGRELTITSRHNGSRARSLTMKREERDTVVGENPHQPPTKGTRVIIIDLSEEAQRLLKAEKITAYLAEELRNRILENKVTVTVVEGASGKRHPVKPKEFRGQPLSGFNIIQVPGHGTARAALYLLDEDEGAAGRVGLAVNGTRVHESLADYPELNKSPWNTGRLEGYIDYPGLTVTPDRRNVSKDQFFSEFLKALAPIEAKLQQIIKEDEERQNEQLDKEVLEKIRKAFADLRPKLSTQLDWFMGRAAGNEGAVQRPQPPPPGVQPGPLHRITIQPQALDVEVGKERTLQVLAFDEKNIPIDPSTLLIVWGVDKNADPAVGKLLNAQGSRTHFQAGDKTGSIIVMAQAVQRSFTKNAQAVVVVVPAINKAKTDRPPQKGPRFPQVLPDTRHGDPRRSWMEKTFDIIRYNKAHPDYVAVVAQKKKGALTRYLARLVAKELIAYNAVNFGTDTDKMLEEFVGLVNTLEGAL
jgi:hypothetical protein